LDQVVTVVGWAKKARLQANYALLYIKLVGGSCAKALQIFIANTVFNSEEVKKSKIGPTISKSKVNGEARRKD